MNKLIENYITNNYYKLLNISKQITKSSDEVSRELLHEVILQILERKEINLIIKDENSIKYWITKILRINYYSKTSPYYYRIKKESELYVELTNMFDIEFDTNYFETIDFFDILEESFTELNWFNKSILQMYLELGSLKKVSKQTRIPLSSISIYVRQSKELIKKDVLNKISKNN